MCIRDRNLNSEYKIYDKLQGALVIIDDPIINYKELIKELKRRSSKVYKSIYELPFPVEEPIDWTKDSEESKSLIFIRRLYDNNMETGSILTGSINKKIKSLKEKRKIEKRLEEYALNNLYIGEGTKIFSDIYRDSASIIIIRNFNLLKKEEKYIQK